MLKQLQVNGECYAVPTKVEKVPHVRGGELAGVKYTARLPGLSPVMKLPLGALGQNLVLEHNSISRESFAGSTVGCRQSKSIDGSYGLKI